MSVAAICGGVGAAKLLVGLLQVAEPSSITAIVNVGDDCEMHGLCICPDLDTITYTTSGAVNPETGWGLADETWSAMDALARFGAVSPPDSQAGAVWFRLGDRDIATHLYRTGRKAEGAPLSTITAEIARAFGLRFRLLPVTDDRLRTRVVVDGEDLDFQSWFVGRGYRGTVSAVTVEGAVTASPAPGVVEAIDNADRIVICPSNPVVSVGPVLAVSAVRDAIARRRESVVAVSPIVGGRALKGPAASLLADLGHEVSAVGVARAYAGLVGTLIVDEEDADLAGQVEAEGVRCVVAPAVMSDPATSATLAATVLSC